MNGLVGYLLTRPFLFDSNGFAQIIPLISRSSLPALLHASAHPSRYSNRCGPDGEPLSDEGTCRGTPLAVLGDGTSAQAGSRNH